MSTSALLSANEPEAALLDFHAPKPEDIAWAKPILRAAGRMGCEYAFGNIYAWSGRYRTEIARAWGFFLARCACWTESDGCRLVYSLPIGPLDDTPALRRVVALLKDDARQRGLPLSLYGLTEGDIPLLEAACPGQFICESDRADADYIYRREDLAQLAGKKYHQKRNHVARFMKNNHWSYEEIDADNREECLKMAREWAELHAERDPEGLAEEERALRRAFEHYEAFGLRGGLLRVGGKIAAFTVGEALGGGTFCTHFEKAMPETGAYQMINKCFAERLTEFEFINREEDLGDEGLRRAKLSYYPERLLEKFIAVFAE
ncbi:MAG: phosphatidylglycerol lysyltransferase domain-containing protein [Oscillospiraceae bacterium]|jgi:hypothetical protein|nr:phosphatidylglycerol lysyltransferase domain-containing protein [Oscillospiraceae bacterium]